MTKKRIIWLLVIALIVGLGYQKHNNDVKSMKVKSEVEKKLSDALAAKTKNDLNNMMHGMYQSWVCDFSKKVQPVTEVLANISAKKAIPPDLIPELKDFNDATRVMAMDDKLFRPDDGLNTDEILIDKAVKNFAKELNLKTAELEQGIISASNPYFLNIKKNVENLVQPACELYAALNPRKAVPPSPLSIATETHKPGSIDAEIDKIGILVSYDAICKLKSSANKLLADIENAHSSSAFKPALLESSKSSIYDLGYAAFSFSGKSMFTPAPNELHWSPEFEVLKSNLENYRYLYWSNNSNSTLKLMKTSANKVQKLGEIGCREVEQLKKS